MARAPNKNRSHDPNVNITFTHAEFHGLKFNTPGPSGDMGGFQDMENWVIANTNPVTLECVWPPDKFTRISKYTREKPNVTYGPGGPNARLRRACIPAFKRVGINLSEGAPPKVSTTVVNPEGFSWSYTALKNFETCPRRYYNYNVAKTVVEPEGPALKEGKRIHEAFDARVAKGRPLPEGLTMHEGLLSKLAAAEGRVSTEQKLALASDFTPTKFFGRAAWFRTVLDYTNVNGPRAIVVDYKTGKVAEDMTQLQLAAVTTFAHDARVQKVDVALAFVAYDHIERASFTRADTTEIWGEILPRVRKLVDARQKQDYPPNPGGLCRRWCAVTSCPHHGR